MGYLVFYEIGYLLPYSIAPLTLPLMHEQSIFYNKFRDKCW